MFEKGPRTLICCISRPVDSSVSLHLEHREASASGVSESITAWQAYDVAYRWQTNPEVQHFREIGQAVFDGNVALRRYITTIQAVTDSKA